MTRQPRRRVSRDAVAQAAGVSPSTVSRALNDSPLLPEQTRRRVQAVAAELGYHINAAARRLASRRSFLLGFALPSAIGRGALQLGYYSETLNAAIQAAEERGYELTLLLHHQGSGSMAQRLATLVAEQRIDGVVLTGLRRSSRLPSQVAELGLPCVLLGCRAGRHASIDYDPRPGLADLVARLRQRKARRICYLSGDPAYSNARDQATALSGLLGDAGLTLSHTLPCNYSLRQTVLALRHRPEALECDAICCANDRTAIGAYEVLRQQGRRIGEDILVSGFDDDAHARILHPSLSTVHQPRVEAGHRAITMLIDHITNDAPVDQERIPTRFVQRESL